MKTRGCRSVFAAKRSYAVDLELDYWCTFKYYPIENLLKLFEELKDKATGQREHLI